MHKLIILIAPQEEQDQFDQMWPEFLHQAERMPGLRREVTSRVETVLYGAHPVTLVHELYFDTLEAARQAMASPAGRAAGKLLQEMTMGRLSLLFADHKEDELENILKYRSEEGQDQQPPTEAPAV